MLDESANRLWSTTMALANAELVYSIEQRPIHSDIDRLAIDGGPALAFFSAIKR